jgi:hypothetical protein
MCKVSCILCVVYNRSLLVSQLKALTAAGILVISNKFIITVETSPVSSQLLKTNTMFVISEFLFHCIKILCYSHKCH